MDISYAAIRIAGRGRIQQNVDVYVKLASYFTKIYLIKTYLLLNLNLKKLIRTAQRHSCCPRTIFLKDLQEFTFNKILSNRKRLKLLMFERSTLPCKYYLLICVFVSTMFHVKRE